MPVSEKSVQDYSTNLCNFEFAEDAMAIVMPPGPAVVATIADPWPRAEDPFSTPLGGMQCKYGWLNFQTILRVGT